MGYAPRHAIQNEEAKKENKVVKKESTMLNSILSILIVLLVMGSLIEMVMVLLQLI